MQPTAHALLRDRRRWAGTSSALAIDRDGDLLLARVPGPGDGKAVDVAASYPYTRVVSGLAVGGCGAVFVSDTAHDRVLFVDGLCQSQVWLPAGAGPGDAPGHFRAPRGLALTLDALLVADSGNARVQSLALPGLEANVAWPEWVEPTSIAADAKQRLLVIDAATRTLHRISASGTPDTAFDAAIAASGKLQTPLFVACAAQDRILVSDGQANAVLVFDAAAKFLFALAGPAGWQPGAVAVFEARAYVADAQGGAIHVFEIGDDSAALVGRVNGWRGPVTALATGADGALYIKPGLDAVYYVFAADVAYVERGSLIAGPFDAGEDRAWERAWAEVQLPTGTAITISVAPQDAPASPTAAEWLALPALDARLAQAPLKQSRYIWLRLELSTSTTRMSPRARQARVATAAENLLDYLPLTYSRHDQEANHFLRRWLDLVRGEFGAVEELIDDMPRVSDPGFAPASTLNWLAQWLAFELPQIAGDDERRELLMRAVALYARRGTKESIGQFVELHTGIRPAIVEAFTDRHIWILGQSSRLDFETRLPALDPLGMVVPDENAGPGCCPVTPPAFQSACAPCAAPTSAAERAPVQTPIGRAIVGESGPLASYQIGLPLYAEAAYRFCVIVDSYRAHDPATRDEIKRIVEREKPAHTDYRLDLIAPETRVGLQAQIGVDFIVGGDPPPLRLSPAHLGIDTQLPPSDAARIGEAALDGTLTLT